MLHWGQSRMLLVLVVLCIWHSQVSLAFRLEDVADGSEELLDLTLEFDENTPYWPSIEAKGQNFKIRETQNGHSDHFGYYFHANVFSSSDHGGTHVDALNHVNKNPINTDIDETPLNQYFGVASVVDISTQSEGNPDYELRVADLLNWEGKFGKIPNNSLLFIYTGWGKKVSNKTAFWGTSDYFNLTKLHYPGVGLGAAEWLIKNRRIKAIGVETGSIDHGQGGLALQTHVAFLSNQINVIETVANLEKMPSTGAFVFGLPMKMKGASGSPIRLVAVGWSSNRIF